MLNLLFLLASAYASDVYEICVAKRQTFNEKEQEFQTDLVKSYYSEDTLQVVIHKTYLEIDREKREIESTYKKDGDTCWREHKNSEFCYDSVDKILYWEFFMRNGTVIRDVMHVCVLNGEAPW